jgi:hypothetical protein
MFWRLLLLHLIYYNLLGFSHGYFLAFYYLFSEIILIFVINLSDKTAGKYWIRAYNGRLKKAEDIRFSDFFPGLIRFFLVRLELFFFYLCVLIGEKERRWRNKFSTLHLNGLFNKKE